MVEPQVSFVICVTPLKTNITGWKIQPTLTHSCWILPVIHEFFGGVVDDFGP